MRNAILITLLAASTSSATAHAGGIGYFAEDASYDTGYFAEESVSEPFYADGSLAGTLGNEFEGTFSEDDAEELIGSLDDYESIWGQGGPDINQAGLDCVITTAAFLHAWEVAEDAHDALLECRADNPPITDDAIGSSNDPCRAEQGAYNNAVRNMAIAGAAMLVACLVTPW